MAAPPVARVRRPGELAALVPRLVGFHPAESLVLMSTGRRGRVGLTVRVDLMARDRAGEQAQQVVAALTRAHPRGALVLVFTSEPDEEAALPRADLVEAVRAGLAEQRVPVAEALLVRGGSWWSYSCTRPCCPREGSPLPSSTPALTQVAAQAALSGRAVLDSRADLVASIAPRHPLGEDVGVRALGTALDGFLRDALADRAAAVEGAVQEWRAALDAWERRPSPPALAIAARLVASVHLKAVRDEVATWSLERADTLLALLVELCRQACPPYDAPISTLLSWVAYADGSGALAMVAVERALATDPDDTMAGLLLQLLQAPVPPEQVRALLRATARDQEGAA